MIKRVDAMKLNMMINIISTMSPKGQRERSRRTFMEWGFDPNKPIRFEDDLVKKVRIFYQE